MNEPQPPPRRLEEPVRTYLAAPCLRPMWDAVRSRLESNGLSVSGTVGVDLDEEAALQLAGLLATPARTGSFRVRLPELDAALRASRAQCGLLTAVADLTGGPLTDLRAQRGRRSGSRTQMWPQLEEALIAGGLGDKPWINKWSRDIRSSGLFSLCPPESASSSIEAAVRVLVQLSRHLNGPDPPPPSETVPLAHLAARTTGDRHGLGSDRLAGQLVLRAIAAAGGRAYPPNASAHRELWQSAGVLPDQVGGHALALGLRPPGRGAWAETLRARADLHLPCHLSTLELSALPPNTLLADRDTTVYVCESPLVLQAAALRRSASTVLCTDGSLSPAMAELLTRLVKSGSPIRCHGAFDWPSIALVDRLVRLGAAPWRMTADDYRIAFDAVDAHVPLAGPPHSTDWDPELQSIMLRYKATVHEEAVLASLLTDLQ